MNKSRRNHLETTRRLLIAMNASDRIERTALCILSSHPERWADARSADSIELADALGVTPKQLNRALRLRPRAAELAEQEIERARSLDCRILTRYDEDYPSPLLDLPQPPPVLYCLGRLPNRPAIAMVGSRKMGTYGERAARLFSHGLATSGVTVVSGFARGIDSTAHRAAIDAGGKTIAVLGCGVDIDYPQGNATLARDIRDHGAVLSEFALGAGPRAWRFPVRNRVIAALAVGTLVVQATYKSGSLITAHHALELGRDVYAIPGSIFEEGSKGTNALIADGASPTSHPRDILESLSIGIQQELFPASRDSGASSTPQLDPIRAQPSSLRLESQRGAGEAAERQPPAGLTARVLEALVAERGRTAEEISARTEVAVEEVIGTLLELEITGWARRAPGPVYLRA